MSLKYYLSKISKKIILLPAIKNSIIDKTSKVCSASNIIKCNIKKYSYIGNYSTVVETDIGSFCSIADNCIIGGAMHPIDWVSTSPVFYNSKNIMNKNFVKHEFNAFHRTVIGNDVWIGNNCLIKSGVIIGDGAIIGMGSTVTKNVESYTIVAGNPAKLIRKRFNDEDIVKLLKIKWWEYNDKEIKEISLKMNNIKLFLSENYKGD